MDASELYESGFRELIKSKKPTVIIPVGSLEQHGAHLPITTDSDIVTEMLHVWQKMWLHSFSNHQLWSFRGALPFIQY